MKSPPSGRETIEILEKIGFEILRVKGSHHILRKGKKRTVVPLHNNRPLGKGLYLKILKDVSISRKEFEKLRN